MTAMRTISGLLLLLVLLVSATGCGEPAFLTAHEGKFPMFEHGPLPEDVTSFNKLFKQNCSACHGAEGKLGPAPPLNDPMFMAIASDEDMAKVIALGRPGTLMPAFSVPGVSVEANGVRGGPLTKKQVTILVNGMRSRWGGAKVKGPLPPYAPADPASGNVDAGKKLFKKACAGCHFGESTLNDPALLDLLSNQALRRIMITGRSDLGMPDFRSAKGRGIGFEPLTEANIDDLMALLNSWRNPEANPAPMR